MSPDNRHVLVLGLDLLAHKHRSQIQGMNRRGWRFTFAMQDPHGASAEAFSSMDDGSNTFVLLPQFGLVWLRDVRRLLRRQYHHVELYACRRSAPYLTFPQIRRQQVLVIERGDLSYYESYGSISRKVVKAHYRRADLIWFKEPYMEPMLDQLSKRPRMFIPNPAPYFDIETPDVPRDIDFLWVNRLLPERTPEVFVKAVGHPHLGHTKAVMLGLRTVDDQREAVIAHQHYCRSIAPANLELLGWTDPQPFFRRARFFVMLGKQIFGNNALLEAMAAGVIPIVSKSCGIQDLVEDGVNGFLVDSHEESLPAALSTAVALDASRELELRTAAIARVRENFNEELFVERLEKAYAKVASGSTAQP